MRVEKFNSDFFVIGSDGEIVSPDEQGRIGLCDGEKYKIRTLNRYHLWLGVSLEINLVRAGPYLATDGLDVTGETPEFVFSKWESGLLKIKFTPRIQPSVQHTERVPFEGDESNAVTIDVQLIHDPSRILASSPQPNALPATSRLDKDGPAYK